MNTKDILQEELKKRKISQKEMSSILNITEAYLSEILSGKKLATGRMFEFAEKLGINLFHSSGFPARHNKPIPVISWVHAGQFGECTDNLPVGVSEGEPVYSAKKVSLNTFGLRIVGDSMEPRYMAGDIIIIDPTVQCDNNCPCCIKLNGEVTFKIFFENSIEIKLTSLNEKYPDIMIRKDSRVDFKVIGKVVDMIPKL